MIKFLPKFSAPNRSVPIAFSPIQLETKAYPFIYPTMVSGWSVFSPSSGAIQTRIAYIDPDAGVATGVLYDYGHATVGADPFLPTSSPTAWASPATAMDAMFTAYGASGSFWFLLKRNAVFATGIKIADNIHGSWPFRGLSPTYPALVGAYGSTTGNRPKITSPTNPLLIQGSLDSKNNIAITSVSFHNVARDPSHAAYVYAADTYSDECIHIYTSSNSGSALFFDDLEIKYFRTSVNQDSSPDPVYNLFFNRCMISRNYALDGGDASACYFAGSRNVEWRECVLDKVGHFPYDPSGRAYGTNRNQAFYIAGLYNDQIRFVGTIVNSPGHASYQVRGGSGNLVSGCVSMRAPYGIALGHDQNDYDDVFGNGISMNPGIRFHQMDVMGNLVMKPDNISYASGLYEVGRIRGEGINAGRINAARIYNNIVTHPYKSSGNCHALNFSEFSWPWDNRKAEVLVSGNIAYDWVGSGDIIGASMHLGVRKTTQGFTYQKLPEENFKFVKNVLIEPNATGVNSYTKGIIHDPVFAFGRSNYLSSGNTFYRVATSGGYVAFNDTTSYNWTAWMADLGDTSSVYGTGIMVTQDWDAPTRDDVSYIASLGLSTASGEDSFILRALDNRKGAWDDRFTASGLINYVAAGFASIITPSGSDNLFGRTVFGQLHLSVFHAIRRRTA